MESGLKAIALKRAGLKEDETIFKAPTYKEKNNSDPFGKFHIEHQRVTSIPQGTPLKVVIKIINKPGIKWVKL